MFLNKTTERNSALIETAFHMHQSGEIEPDSYVIDVDTLLKNAKMILDEADSKNIKLYFMLKQFGRNPYIAKELVRLGYSGAVVVDFREASLMMEHNIPIGNVGHLVQVPENMIDQIVAYNPEVMTVYSMEKLEHINAAAKKLGKQQKLLIRVYDERDLIYSGQTAGFSLDELKEQINHIKKLEHIQIAGVTSFPCYLYNDEAKRTEPTNNLKTVMKAVAILEENKIKAEIINTPSSSCIETLRLMEKYGGNCAEPGHGLSGTTPSHAFNDLPECPCVVYVSEISHNFRDKAYCYGGGFYRRSKVEAALVGSSLTDSHKVAVIPPNDDSIDYHFGLSTKAQPGESVIMAFRFQIFVTRSNVVLVSGIKQGKPRIVGVYDSLGKVLNK